jgi:hypothetical protein
MRIVRAALLVLVLVGLGVFGGRAWALTQPNGTPIPSAMGCNAQKPTGLAAVFACECLQPGVCNIGGVCPAPGQCPNAQIGTCETTLAHVFNDNTCIPSQLGGLDPWAQAATTPETFQPTCALTFTVVSRGTALFKDAFGWYNVTGTAPTPDQLYTMLDCTKSTGQSAVLDIQNDPRWLGGEVGFFLVTPEAREPGKGGTCAGGDCCATVARLGQGQGRVYYSQRGYNPDAAGASSFIHLLVYDSRITTSKFYFAWEDIFGGSNNDFTDLVTSVEGVECSGGGGACDTGKPGACALGVATCEQGSLGCHDLVAPVGEVCNGVDDDCDGVADDGASCPAGQRCDGGRCTPDCKADPEFQCPGGLACEAGGRCVDPGCVGKPCPSDKVCKAGACVAPCDGIVCPRGTSCISGACLALCDAAQCPAGEVCREGVCLPGCDQCGGVACTGALTCAQDGECRDPSCPQGCPAGRYCEAGMCKDACDGAICPEGQVCEGGRCRVPGGFPDAGPSAGAPDGGDPGVGGDRASPGVCGCVVGRVPRSGAPWGFGLSFAIGLGLAVMSYRSRRARRLGAGAASGSGRGGPTRAS